MRKILLGTTAFVGAALLSTGAMAQHREAPASIAPGQAQGATLTAAPSPSLAGAGGLTVRLGGYFEFSGALIQDDNDSAYRRNTAAGTASETKNVTLGSASGTLTIPGAAAVNNSERRQRSDFRNDLELNVFVDGRAANGMTYGAVFEFQMDNQSNTTVDMDEAFGFIAMPNLGRIYFGQEDSAASLLAVRAPGAGALGGDAVWDEFINQTGLYSSPYLTSGINDGNDATKIGYLSPQFAGFDFGISYAPNSGEGERVDTQRDRTGTSTNPGAALENEISAAIRYRGTFGPVGVQLGVGGMWASHGNQDSSGVPYSGVNAFQDLNAYFVGGQVAAYGFAIGAEYAFGAYNGSSVGRAALRSGLDDSWHYLVGATYTVGPLVFGAVYGQGEQDNGTNKSGVDLDDRKHTVWGLGVLYNMAPGLGLYVAYNNVVDENIPTGAPAVASGGKGGTTLAQNFGGPGGLTRTINIGMAGIRLAF